MLIREITTDRALKPLRRRGLPYKFDLNIYGGCSHGCLYCYARKNEEYTGNPGYESEIFLKTNVDSCLDKELNSPEWKKNIINIGGVCDSYQNIEKSTQMMRKILKVMIKHKNPVIISTKSDLILRDLDLIDELANHTYVNIAVCITNCDDKISKVLEPGASCPENRFNALTELKKTRAFTALHFMPIVPFFSDSLENLTAIVSWAARSKVDYLLSGVLYLTGHLRYRFLNFVKNDYPEHYSSYQKLYRKGSAGKNYKSKIHQILGSLRKKYQVNNRYAKYLPKKREMIN